MEAAAVAASSQSPAPCSPHLKKVLKTYQLTAVKSLQGPSTALAARAEDRVRAEREEEEEDEDELPPPPPPVQQPPPLLAVPDQSCSERSETVLEGETIACFAVGGEKRLCLPQVLNSVLRDFSLQQINQVCDELLIYCSRCTPDQLEELKVSGVLPAAAPSCGLITKTDAERLCSALLHRAGPPPPPAPPCPPDALSIRVYHECFGKCSGICTPELFARGEPCCIECAECHGMFSPQRFVCHAHRALENRTCHWGFDSSNWTRYLHVAEDQAEHERLAKLLDAFKQQASVGAPPPSLKRKQLKSAIAPEFAYEPGLTPSARLTKRHKSLWYEAMQHYKEPSETLLKRARLDAGDAAAVYVCPEQLLWCDAWAPRIAFRHWPLPLPAHHKDKTSDSIAAVPAYLSHSPPVLLHPERVVPLSESERFERSFQPNVALAPIPRTRVEDTKPEVKMEIESDHIEKQPATLENSSILAIQNIPLHYNPEIELSTDTDDSLSDGASLAMAYGKDSLAEVLDALSGDLTEERRDRIVRVVERLKCFNRLLERENDLLKQIRILQRHRKPVDEQDGCTDEISKLEDQLAEVGSRMLKLGFRPQSIQSGGGSPVSVITSPPPIIKSEPANSE